MNGQTGGDKATALAITVVVALLLAGAVVLFQSAHYSNANPPPDESSVPYSPPRIDPPPRTAGDDLSLLDKSGSVDAYGLLTITGHVKNSNPSKTYGYAQISFNVYDGEGSQVGSAMSNINNLEPDGVWAFSAVCLAQGGTTYKLKEITGF